MELIAELEQLSQQGLIDLFCGDETGSHADHVCSQGYVPYGWQFPDEDIYIPVEKGYKINIWGLISRLNQHHWAITEQNINASFVFEQLERLSFQIQKQTVVMIDNASIHKAKIIQQQLKFWAKKRIIYFLSPSIFTPLKYC